MKSTCSIFLIFCIIIFSGITACRSSKNMTQSKPEKPETVSYLSVMFDTSKVFTSNFTGFALYDPAGDSLIYGQNEDRYFTPASNTKLFTFYTGLKLLPDSLRALEYVVRGDSLVFWGTGDPSFLHPDIGNGTVYEFLKGREEKLYFSDSNFDDKLLGPGWSWDDYNYYYQTEKTPLPMYGNVARFEVQEIDLRQVTSADGGLSVSPAFFRKYIRESEKKREDMLFRDLDGNIIEYKPEADTTTYTVEKPYHYSPQLITDMLADTLQRPVGYLPNIEKPDSARVLYSIAADTAYKHMLLPSDNFIAEQLLLVTASELGMPLNSRSVIDKMKTEYLDVLPQESQWVDGSGLSRYNMFTPRSMIRLLSEIDDEYVRALALFKLLPAGGKSGTIENWYAARDDSSAYVFAKTGTLSNNHCLSGYVTTESGKKLIFSFMNNHYVTSSDVVKKEMEKILWYIYENF